MPPPKLQPLLPWDKDSQGSVTLQKTFVFPYYTLQLTHILYHN